MASRRGSASSTVSVKPLPPGHWTLPISGNCPRCYHHHQSTKIRVTSSNESSRLADLRCERCDNLWLSSGGISSARISLLSIDTNEVNDPLPVEPEVRSALAQMIRQATRVATLSPTLPDIQEPVPYAVSSVGARNRKDFGSATSIRAPAVTRSGASGSNRVARPQTRSANMVQSMQLLSRLRKRILSSFPVLRTTRIGSLLEPKNSDNKFVPTKPQQPEIALTSNQVTLESIERPTDREHRLTLLTKGSHSRMVVDKEVIDAMTPEQRFAVLRSKITKFTTQQSATPELQPKSSSQSDQDDQADSLVFPTHPLNEIREGFNEQDHPNMTCESDLESNGRTQYDKENLGSDGSMGTGTECLNVLEALSSGPAGLTKNQTFASSDYLMETLPRGLRMSDPIRLPRTNDGVDLRRPPGQPEQLSGVEISGNVLDWQVVGPDLNQDHHSLASSRSLSTHGDQQKSPELHLTVSAEQASADHVPGNCSESDDASNSRTAQENQAADTLLGPRSTCAGQGLQSAKASPAAATLEYEDITRTSATYPSDDEKFWWPTETTEIEPDRLFQLVDYDESFHQSDPFQWLLSGKKQRERLSFGGPDAMTKIGDRIFGELHALASSQDPGHLIRLPLTTMAFRFEWPLDEYFEDMEGGMGPKIDSTVDIASKLLCLTGIWLEAQAMSVSDYLHQTWPRTGPLMSSMIHELVVNPKGHVKYCKRSAVK